MIQPSPVVAFQGVPGAYSHLGAQQYFGEAIAILPCRQFGDLFAALERGTAQHAILPMENSLAGTVVPAYDELVEHDLIVQGEVIVAVDHCLMAPAGAVLEEIRRAMSHPQALAQCRQTLQRQGIEPVIHFDTAGAARDLAASPQPGTAAIASELAAVTYGLEILERNIQDLPFNYTRMFVIGTEPLPRRDPSKTSITFTVRHTPGALYTVMGELARRQINLSKIESRPRRDRPWHYRFYVDFEGHVDDPPVSDALIGILQCASSLRVLGSYRAAELTGA